ncbi:MAG TPA: hypothetical protein VJ716_02855 [Gaiellaceae bacterium]|nr:hypothetical protein [Gaiellaceae bacterium]
MSRALGIWAKKQEIYLAVAEDGEVSDADPQRIEAPSIMETNERLGGFITSVRHALNELSPDEVRILQPEQTYSASYSEFAPRVALETAVRLVCEERGIPVEVLHRSTARSRLGFDRRGSLDSHIAGLAVVGKYWNAGRKYAAVAALAGREV